MGFLKSAIASSLLLAASANAELDPIVRKGSKFFYKSSGEQFFMKGIAYQQEVGAGSGSTGSKYIDPLSDKKICERDIPIMKDLQTNTIRTYAIDPTKDHSDCMKLLDEAGIYVVADLGEPSLSINRESPAWNTDLFDRYKGVVDEMSKYTNTIGFFAGNEVTNNNTNTPASAYVKAAVRDTKKYIKDTKNRWMGVGYAANDDADIRDFMAQYFNCGEEEESIDFWGYNIYSWCGDSSFEKSGYDVQVKFFSNYSVPVFFAEYGCNSDGAENRKFSEVEAIYSDKMTGVISGGIVYMYYQEANDYGLVQVKDGKATPMKDAKALKDQLKDVKPSGVKMADYEPTNKPQSCPATGKDWKVTERSLPPTPDNDLCDCIAKTASCGPAKDLEEKDFGEIFGYVCSQDPDACAGIKGDTEKGVYGPYLGCAPRQQLSAVLDAYYKNQNEASDACDFKGKAVVNKDTTADSQCSAKIEKASKAAALAATATGATGTSSTGGSESGNPAPALRVATFSLGNLAVGAYMVAAMGVGAGMLLL